jgi:hypothetical protein
MQSTKWWPYGVICVAGLASGCANWNSAYRSEQEGGLKAIAVDAKQRFAFIRTSSKESDPTIVCPEPSPDALSAGSISVSLDASKATVADLKAALGTAEQASSIGLRTQSIQLLRDQLSHLCLMRMADPGNKVAHVAMFKRYQASTLGVLAIEQLTGAVKASQMTVSANGNAAVEENTPPVPGAPANSASTANASDKPKSPTANTHTGEAKTITHVYKTNMESVADTVYKIVDLIVMDSFSSENCNDVMADPNYFINKDKLAPIVSVCVSRHINSSCAKVKDKDQNRECQKDMANSFPKILFPENEVAAAGVSRAASMITKTNPTDSYSFSALNFGIFRCKNTDNSFNEKMKAYLKEKGVQENQINDRGLFSKEELAIKGFKFPGKIIAEVLYDKDIDSEINGAAIMLEAVKKIAGDKAIKSENKKDKTPLYISVAFCSPS